jgi:AcrR family transcriptional regulator
MSSRRIWAGKIGDMASDALPGSKVTLRERKKQQTRSQLIETALECFAGEGFSSTTLEMLCDRVQVSKRTFFRYFTSKEDVALAPGHDLWRQFLTELEVAEPDGRPLFALSVDAMHRALNLVDFGGWSSRLLRSYALAERTPSMRASGLEFCAITAEVASEILHRNFAIDQADEIYVQLGTELFTVAVRHALSTWALAHSSAGPETATAHPPGKGLHEYLDEAVAALPASLSLTAPRRPPGKQSTS